MITIKNLKCLVLILSMSLTSKVFAQQKFTISGNAPGKNGQKVELVRFTEGSIQNLAADTIKNEKFHISVPVDEISLALIQIDKKFGGTVAIEPAHLMYSMAVDGTFGTEGGKYTTVLNGFLKNKAFIAADDLFKKLTKGGNIAAIKGTKEEWEMIEPFLKKEDLRSSYLANLVKSNPDPKVKVMAAIMCELQPDAAKTMEIINKVAPQVGENTIMMRRVRSMEKQQAAALARRHEGMLGQQFTDFTAVNLKGESMNLAPIVKNNKYTLLQFWASWCGPCRKEIPLLKQLYSKYKSKGLEIVSFSMDDNKYNWEKASEVEKFNWINVSDLRAFGSGVAKVYPIFGIPANVIIDQNGKILASNLLDKELETKIAELLK
ncbi:TlpA disulfide reductase family protein [Pedobacter sp. MC2016-24]|uniref:TlpA family protein disulfide reductase n=1 Tax=Pedobacter sp. MC2016-24 TaxID=2780090 RepID=UPI0018805D2E|nr:TlpA disulfide reductase family protein [Pedobacter sp. MC2016-24]MBE9601080.1 AhpC/TSA family protein [Pedobacter sp. MC2016-24]